MSYDILILTQHGSHSPENSVYALAAALSRNAETLNVHLATSSSPANKAFFDGDMEATIAVIHADQDFTFGQAVEQFKREQDETQLDQYDFVLLRLPPPVPFYFFEALLSVFPDDHVINNPRGIIRTASKLFLQEVRELCPQIWPVGNYDELLKLRGQFPLVLKPEYSYAGKGIVKVGDTVEYPEGNSDTLDSFGKKWPAGKKYLAMEFLVNVHLGDKRTVVVNGEVIGSSLRLPAVDSWICNVAQGGSSQPSSPDDDELSMVKTLAPLLKKQGVVIFGMDTLVGNDGRRKLSELNTMSIGGIAQIARQGGKSADDVAQLLINYMHDVWYGN